MQRKWMILVAGATAMVLTATGLSLADDDESPIHKLMEKVNVANNTITKAVRNAPAYKKAQKEVVTSVEELIKLGKEAREIKEPAEKQKKTHAEWTKLMDEYIKKAEELKVVASKPASTQPQVKTAHGLVKVSCSKCHDVFRVDE